MFPFFIIVKRDTEENGWRGERMMVENFDLLLLIDYLVRGKNTPSIIRAMCRNESKISSFSGARGP